VTGIEVGVAVIVGVLLGRFLPNRRKGPKPRKQPEPICGCDHHHSYHDPKTGECHGLVQGDPVRYNEYDRPMAWEQVQCSCKQYSGPQPLPEFYAPEVTS
jgi:hypothetical protein